MRISLNIFFLITLCAAAYSADTQRLNGFDLDEPLVPAGAIEKGGPPRDGIPSIDSPLFVAADEAGFLDPDDRILGITQGGNSKAYPVKILDRHEIVNDWLNQKPVVVTYCPLCGSGIAFSAMVEGRELTFGVSGLLYNSDVLLYDRQTGSLWSQIAAKSINGSLKGRELTQLPLQHTTWKDWRARHPNTRVLSTQTGFRHIDYDQDPYKRYKNTSRLMFSVSNTDKRLRNKDWVLGVVADGIARAYPFDSLDKEASPIQDQIGDVAVSLHYDDENQTAIALDQNDEVLESIQLYWFAWAAFHPDTTVWNCSDDCPCSK
jgi:hypothetical protein